MLTFPPRTLNSHLPLRRTDFGVFAPYKNMTRISWRGDWRAPGELRISPLPQAIVSPKGSGWIGPGRLHAQNQKPRRGDVVFVRVLRGKPEALTGNLAIDSFAQFIEMLEKQTFQHFGHPVLRLFRPKQA